MSKLTISEALTILEDGNWHSVAYVSADTNKNEGGRIVRIPRCRIHSHVNLKHSAQPQSPSVHTGKTQRHSIHATRNLMLANGRYRKMHIYTLFSVDQTQVI